MPARSPSTIIFRILYNSVYGLFLLVLIVLLGITPGDLIYQTIANTKLGNVFVVGASYFVTALIAAFIYASRLYTTRATLAAIPKSYIPVEDGEVPHKVRRMIIHNRQRSALVAFETRPRDIRPETQIVDSPEKDLLSSLSSKASAGKNRAVCNSLTVAIDPEHPPWGHLIHPGWSAPDSEDLPDLQFHSVVSELPNLMEAKAVSLAPPNPAFDFLTAAQGELEAPPDPHVVSVLQRPPSASMRDYVDYLHGLGVIPSEELSTQFVNQYEYARYSTHALLEGEFRRLMAIFSDVLLSMVTFDPTKLADNASSGKSIRSVKSSSSSGSVVKTRPSAFRLNSQNSISSMRSSESVVHHVKGESV